MTEVSFLCTRCRHQISFKAEQVNSIQECPNCGQQVLVPSAQLADSAMALTVQQPQAQPNTPVTRSPAQHGYQQERSREAQASRKLKMGSGCFAMLAVMFATALIADGIGILTEVNQDKLWGLSAVIGGLAGLAAFIFFGYVATETASKSSDRGRM